jgi:hypothetical protein
MREGAEYTKRPLAVSWGAVVLADEFGTNLVFTTDKRDFGVYRIKGRRRFEIHPG